MTEQCPDKLIIYGTTWCGMCRRTRGYLDRQQIPYEFINIDDNEEAGAFVEKVNRGYRSVPTLVSPDGSILTEPSESQLIAWLESHLVRE
ncbi:MAG: glutaredoxin domain-containing protein [Anaerolineaceae bacterium]|nr:glutaredoxin domain-containing protein [Anaerolineaceae bacterium]